MNFLIKLILYSIAVLLTSYLLPGVHVDGFISAFILAAVISLLNITIKPLLIILTIPATILTMGLFLLVINAIIILIADAIIPGVQIEGFLWALLFSLIVSFLNSLFSGLSTDKSNNHEKY